MFWFGCERTTILLCTGWPVATLSRGEVLWRDGAFNAAPGRGRFLARAPYDYIKPRGVFPGPFNPFG